MDEEIDLNDPTNAGTDAAAAAETGLDAGAPSGDELTATGGSSAAQQLLDSLTEGAPEGGSTSDRPRDPAGRFTSREGEDAPAGQQAPQPAAPAPAGQQPGATPPAPAANAQEQADRELLASITSDRGRQRVQGIIESRNAAQGQVQAVRNMVEAAGLNAESFGEHLEFARLMASQQPQDLQQAAAMLERVRTALYRRLGQDAPGVDALADHPDLAQRVQALEMPRETALELANLRRQQAAVQQDRQQQHQAQQDQANFQRAIQGAQSDLMTYVKTREHEVDHPARWSAVQAYFDNPQNMQEFVRTYRPEQWSSVLRMLYDNASIAPQRRPAPAPISSRPAALGRPMQTADQPAGERIMSRIEELGI